MRILRSLALVAAGLILGGGVAFAQSNSKEIMALDQAKLIGLLKDPAAPQFDKAKACQRLAVIGTADAVPAIVPLLADEHLNVYARTALENIPDPAAVAALREAAAKLTGRQQIGVINSLGVCKDAAALSLLKNFLNGSDKETAGAAAHALGRFGTTEAAAVLQEALGKASVAKRCVADGVLTCAEGLAAAGKKDEALKLYEAAGQADVPRYVKVAALLGRCRLLQAEAQPLILAQLHSNEIDFFEAGLALARQTPGPAMTAALVAELPKLDPQRQALVLRALGDRKDRVPLATVVAASKSEAAVLRTAAIDVLASLRDASSVGILLDAALGDGEAAVRAREGLQTLPGKEADAAVAERLAKGVAAEKAVLFELAGARRVTAATPTIKAALADANPELRLAALKALAQLLPIGEIDLLASRALVDGDSADIKAAREALRVAALRMGDRDATAAKLAEYLPKTSGATQTFVMELIGKVSGAKALEVVVAAAKSSDPTVKELGTRVLGEWVNAEAAPALLDIAKTDEDQKYQVRAMRGYIRIARQLQMPDTQRLEMFKTVMSQAKRVEEKKLALDILTRIPSPDTLKVAVEHLGQPGFKDPACNAAVTIGTKVLRQNPKAVAEAMQKVVDAGPSPATLGKAKQLLGQAQSAAK